MSFVAFGEGAVWTGNYVDGTVARIDPGTNDVTARTSVGVPQALAGAGAAWVSVAAGTTEGALTAAGCGEVASGGGKPDVLIASDLPPQGPTSADPRSLEGAIRFVDGGVSRPATTRLATSPATSTPQSGSFEFRKCAANASAFAHAEQLVAVIGPWSSYCGQVGIPIMNRAPGGPLAVVSPISTHPGLTRGGPVGERGEPDVYYPTGVRSFARVMAREDLQVWPTPCSPGSLGLKRVFVLYDRSDFWRREFANPFLRTARRLGIRIAGPGGFSSEPRSKDRLADRVARSGAEGVFIAGAGSEVVPRCSRPSADASGPGSRS